MEFNTFTCTSLRPLNVDSSPKPKNGSLKVVVYDASKGEEKRISLSFIYFLILFPQKMSKRIMKAPLLHRDPLTIFG